MLLDPGFATYLSMEFAFVSTEKIYLSRTAAYKDFLKKRSYLINEYLVAGKREENYTVSSRSYILYWLLRHISSSSEFEEIFIVRPNSKRHCWLRPWALSNKFQVLADDPAVKRGKPEPDAFLVTKERFTEKPVNTSSIVVFEDSMHGARAAIAAGMHVVMVPNERYSKPPDDIKHKISFVLKSLEEFRPETMGLPSYD